uniref:sulfatase-like hydrolase/transferase n=1 Tax=Cellvibrio fontiphilus TaxID=1815559 RepID=UPI002B4BDDF5|nr:sulfatase-like hydrolase/transferase [Cellvibrio fontiphilus]
MNKRHFVAHGYFTLLVLLLSFIPLSSYWWMMPAPDNSHGKLYLLSSIGYYGLLLTIIGLACLPLAISKFTRLVYALLLALWLIFLGVDAATFSLYLFHVDWIMLEMFVMDFEGLGLPNIILFTAIAAAVLIIAGCGWLSSWIHKKYTSQLLANKLASDKLPENKQATPLRELYRPGFGTMTLFSAISIVTILFVINSSINIWADKYHRQEVSYINPYLPLYRPVTSSKYAETLAHLAPAVLPPLQGKMDRAAIQEKSVVRYPLEPLQCAAPTKKPSIIMLVVESWQAAALNQDVMPNITRFSKQTTQFNQHISGGSATIPGLFSLFYGLHASYYPAFKATPAANPSEFTETLAEQGYKQYIFTNSNLDRFAMRSLIFPRVAPANFYQEKTDAAVVDQFLQQHRPSTTEARFDFVFLTSSHSPYKYPKKFSRFTPLPSVKGGYAFNKHADNIPYKNDYYNSLYYVDHLLGKIVNHLEKTGALENTWVVVTGDHAEEFNENAAGFWGHGSNFTRWQTHTPLLIHAPGQTTNQFENRVSSHQDIVPTLMENVLGCSTAREAYSTGANLFALPETRSLVMSSYYNNAYWVDGAVLDRSNGKQYSWVDINNTAITLDKQKLHQVQDEERRFFRDSNSRGLLSGKH